MMLRLVVLFSLVSAVPVLANEPSDSIQGNWLGTWEGQEGMGGKNVAQIYGLGHGEYQALFTAYDSGEQDKGEFTFAIRGATTADGTVVFDQSIDLGGLGVFNFHAEIVQGKFSGKYSNGKEYQGTMELARVNSKPDTVGQPPLPGAQLLFDGNSLTGWTVLGDSDAEWRITDRILTAPTSDRLSAPKAGHLVCEKLFGHAQVHVEFRVPYLPEKRGENRGQSGVILFGKYELQIVDSFGFPRLKDVQGNLVDTDSLGAIYGQVAPAEQPALPPGEWQAFDITMKPETLDAQGRPLRPAELTVRLNGTTIHDRVPVTKPTLGGPFVKGRTMPALMLQNSGQPVEFRNVWMVALDAAN